jgi:hypothetical protein
MEIAALISFAVLLVAWIMAPERGAPERAAVTATEPEPLPVAA